MFLNVLNGKEIDEAVLAVTENGDFASEYLRIEMNYVKIASLSSGDNSNDGIAFESVGLDFQKVCLEYRSPGDMEKECWDRKTNQSY